MYDVCMWVVRRLPGLPAVGLLARAAALSPGPGRVRGRLSGWGRVDEEGVVMVLLRFCC